MTTRRVYKAEARWKAEEWYMGGLQALADFAWFQERPKQAPPRVVAARGARYGGRGLLSYYDPDTHTIYLSRHQRDPKVLLHELVHALGNMKHDDAFWSKLLDLLRRHRIPVLIR